jgi:hypothetical protein
LSPPVPPQHVAIFGRPGSGKSSLTERLSHDHGMPWCAPASASARRSAAATPSGSGSRSISRPAPSCPTTWSPPWSRRPSRPSGTGDSCSTASPGRWARSRSSTSGSARGLQGRLLPGRRHRPRGGDRADGRPSRLPDLRGELPHGEPSPRARRGRAGGREAGRGHAQVRHRRPQAQTVCPSQDDPEMASWMETESSDREPKSCGSPARGQAHEWAINPRAAKYPRGHR